MVLKSPSPPAEGTDVLSVAADFVWRTDATLRVEKFDVLNGSCPAEAVLAFRGARFDPPKYLRAGDVVTVTVPGIGTLENRIEDEAVNR